ncbi:hypothetical protein ACTPGW_002619 [Enterococcus faecalis]
MKGVKRKINDKVTEEGLKWKYSNDTVPFFARIGFKIGFGLMMVIVAGLSIYHVTSSKENTYDSLSQEPSLAIQELSQVDNDFTLVLYRADCKACQSVEHRLVKDLKKLSDDEKRKIVATDLQKMSDEQLISIQKMLPAIMIDGTKIPTPLVANVKVDKSGEISILNKSDSDNYKEIKNVLNDSKNK